MFEDPRDVALAIFILLSVVEGVLLIDYYTSSLNCTSRLNLMQADMNNILKQNMELANQLQNVKSAKEALELQISDYQKEIDDLHENLRNCRSAINDLKHDNELLADFIDREAHAGSAAIAITGYYLLYSAGEYDYIPCDKMDSIYSQVKIYLEDYKDFLKNYCDLLNKYTRSYATEESCESELKAVDDVLSWAHELKLFCDYRS